MSEPYSRKYPISIPPENQEFSDIFKGYRNSKLAWKGLMRS